LASSFSACHFLVGNTAIFRHVCGEKTESHLYRAERVIIVNQQVKSNGSSQYLFACYEILVDEYLSNKGHFRDHQKKKGSTAMAGLMLNT